jgi:hypothetical protein
MLSEEHESELKKKKKQKVDPEKELKKIVDDQIRQKSLEKIKRRNW